MDPEVLHRLRLAAVELALVSSQVVTILGALDRLSEGDSLPVGLNQLKKPRNLRLVKPLTGPKKSRHTGNGGKKT